MGINKRLINTGGAAPAPIDPLANFETVTYTGNGATQKINGYIRKGAAFNGTSSRITTSFIVPADPSMSFSFWFNRSSTQGGGGDVYLLSDLDSSANGNRIDIRIAQGFGSRIFIDIGNGSSRDNQDTGFAPNNDTWYNLVVTLNGTAVKMYIDGTQKISYTSAVAFGTAGADPIVLGRAGAYDCCYLRCRMDQLRIFNSTITQANVNTLKDETYASATKSTTDIFGNGSGISLYQLEDNSYDTGVAIDSGQSGVFNGTTSEISLGNSNSFSYTTTGALSINMWIKTTNTSTAYVISKANDSSGQYEWAIEQLSNGTLTLHAYNNAGGFASSINNTAVINDGNWHNVVGVIVNNTSTTLYIDRTSTTSTSFSGTAASYSIPTLIGHFGGIPAATSFFEGGIDQVRLYSSSLSAADVTNIYNETNIPTSNFVSWYKLDGNANDSKGSNNGTWSGSEAYSTAAIRNYSGTDTAINYLGMAFKPDLVWIKQRSGTRWHELFDSVRGATKRINSNDAGQEGTAAESLKSFDTNGFTLGNDLDGNQSNQTFVAWCWRAAASTTTIPASGNRISSTVRANVEAGFSIVKATSTSSGVFTVSHGLEAAPELYIIKNLASAGGWLTYVKSLGADKYLQLNENAAAGTSTQFWNNTDPSTTVFTMKSGSVIAPNVDFSAYCWHSVPDYQKVGSYTGGGASNVTVSLGFEPRWIMVKGIANGYNWVIWDQVRKAGTVPYDNDFVLFANTSVAEKTDSTARGIQFTSTGFVLNQNNILSNDSGVTYIFLAIA